VSSEEIRLELNGFQRFRSVLDPPRFKRVLQKHVGRATAQNGKRLVREMRQKIKGGIPPPNAALTVAIKGSSGTLRDTGHGIFQAITSNVLSWDRVEVGVIRRSGAYDIAKTVHDGVTIRVTEKMRWMFRLLYWASIGHLDPAKLTGRAKELWERTSTVKGPRGRDPTTGRFTAGGARGIWRPIKDSTSAIIIPGRPFAKLAFEDKDAIEWCKQNWEKAVEAAFDELAGGGR